MLRPLIVEAARRDFTDAVRWYRAEAGAERATDFVVSDYPYVVVAASTDVDLVVYAVAHQSREPGYWKPRLASVRP